ncbi:MAG: hypothetical protein EPO11_02685, partial [Gammaproteobacteria bacterium]
MYIASVIFRWAGVVHFGYFRRIFCLTRMTIYKVCMHSHRRYTFFDRLCLGLDQAVRALTDNAKTTRAPYPAAAVEESLLSDEQRKHSA